MFIKKHKVQISNFRTLERRKSMIFEFAHSKIVQVQILDLHIETCIKTKNRTPSLRVASTTMLAAQHSHHTPIATTITMAPPMPPPV